jgi:DNA uptake protein ComE-like DNA-binding protein
LVQEIPLSKHRTSQLTFFLAAAMVAGTCLAADPAKPATAQAAPPDPKPAASKSTAAVKKPAKLVEINSASFEQLKTVPGIGDIEATRIIKNRPYTTRSNLVSKGAISYEAYFALKDYITVNPPDPKTLKK